MGGGRGAAPAESVSSVPEAWGFAGVPAQPGRGQAPDDRGHTEEDEEEQEDDDEDDDEDEEAGVTSGGRGGGTRPSPTPPPPGAARLFQRFLGAGVMGARSGKGCLWARLPVGRGRG